jgi:hypothetical protein
MTMPDTKASSADTVTTGPLAGTWRDVVRLERRSGTVGLD